MSNFYRSKALCRQNCGTLFKKHSNTPISFLRHHPNPSYPILGFACPSSSIILPQHLYALPATLRYSVHYNSFFNAGVPLTGLSFVEDEIFSRTVSIFSLVSSAIRSTSAEVKSVVVMGSRTNCQRVTFSGEVVRVP